MTKFLLCVIVFCISIIITFARINAGSEKMGFSSKNPPETTWQLLSHKKYILAINLLATILLMELKTL